MPDPEPDLVDSLVQSSFLVQGVLRRVARRHDVSVIQMRLLGILRDREPGVLVLARHLGLDKSSVTGLVDRAEGRGLVERVADPDDGRAVRVRLTGDGRALATTGAAEVAGELATVAAGLTAAQRRQLAGLLSRIVGPVARSADRPPGG
ncbi:MAG TPA: MarR family transcriptional regulator [Solirubrobacterales bacterium]|nr:MarR family transcriptional regulator [Solirubrobacterales bacterium]